MRGKRYLAVTVLSWLIIIFLGWYFVYDIPRMDRAEADRKVEAAAIGAVIYAENCVVCHGASGQGHVGPPLFTEGFRGDPDENKDVYDLLYRTIEAGRPGTADPLWVRLPTGQWASYTAMPAWGGDFDGPMNEQELHALTHFIMMGDWSTVSRRIPAAIPWISATTREVRWDQMPTPDGLTAEEVQRGKELFVNKTCIACHTLGNVGAGIGPNLTKVGAWGVDEDFLKDWIRNPAQVEERAPRYWSNYGGPYQFPLVVGDETDMGQVSVSGTMTSQEGGALDELAQIPSVALDESEGGALPDFPMPNTVVLPPTEMPALGLTDDEIDDLVRYLIHLK